jgi:saccharopine dehydrogenase-like NADP-dependent oxidoreductase
MITKKMKALFQNSDSKLPAVTADWAVITKAGFDPGLDTICDGIFIAKTFIRTVDGSKPYKR